ncbi:MAG: hypothetical protein WBB28_20675 [Crinalium sp.]
MSTDLSDNRLCRLFEIARTTIPENEDIRAGGDTLRENVHKKYPHANREIVEFSVMMYEAFVRQLCEAEDDLSYEEVTAYLAVSISAAIDRYMAE